MKAVPTYHILDFEGTAPPFKRTLPGFDIPFDVIDGDINAAHLALWIREQPIGTLNVKSEKPSLTL
jgi:hypothetical protein